MVKKNKILVTAALPYANGSIHIGHLVEYIQTDIYVRFLKLIGKDAIFCCADDTHGTAIEIKAANMKITPEELIKKVYKEHLDDFKAYLIDFDSYYSTNSEENKQFSDKIFHALKDKGLIYTKNIEALYDEKAKRFLPDRYVKGTCPKCGAKDQYGDVCEKCNATYKPDELIDPFSTLSGEKPVLKESVHYFFKLSSLSGKLDDWLLNNKELQPEIVNYVRNWIKEGLRDWDISRDGPYFGFKIPGEENKYYYVWLDAPVGYIASTQNYCSKNGFDCEKDYWMNPDSEINHFIGKDIIYFHFLFWPAMLMEAGFNLPKKISVHGFLTVNGEKMSKSRGTFLTAREFLEYLDPEYLRYFYAANLNRSMTDLDLDLKDLKNKINNELVSNIANFMYRVLKFTNANFDGKITKISDKSFIESVVKKCDDIKESYNNINFRDAVRQILEVSDMGNRHFQANAPWKLIKEDRDNAQAVLTDCVNVVKILSILLKPIIPRFSETIEGQLGLKKQSWDDIPAVIEDVKLGQGEIVFKRIEDIKLKAKKENKDEGNKEEKVDPFAKLNLKVAEICEISEHYKADKLYVINLKVGDEKRQIVSGLKPYYPNKEDLLGKKIILVSNLKHANLRGEKSEGMLLAAEDKEGNVEVLEAPETEHGSQVFIEGIDPLDRTIEYGEFAKAKMDVVGGKVVYSGKVLKTEKEEIKSGNIKDGFVG